MNVESLVVEGITAIKERQESTIWGDVSIDPLFMQNLNIILSSTLRLKIVGLDYESTEGIWTLCKVVFEIGRLAGRSEIVRETMGE